MKALSLAASIVFGGLALAGSRAEFPTGTYEGTADWRGPGGKTGTYTVEKTFEGNRVTAHYTWTDAQARDEKHTITFAEDRGASLRRRRREGPERGIGPLLLTRAPIARRSAR